MPSIAGQGLQSCLEVEHNEPRLLRLKLAPPNTNVEPEPIPCNEEKDDIARGSNTNNIDTGGWSFDNADDSTRNDQVYVHPLAKRSGITLSELSLEMCTENLGNETGSDIKESDDIAFLALDSGVNRPSKPRETIAKRKTRGIESFPPPLTSISDSDGVKVVESRREGGRLVLQAVAIPPCNRYIHAERSEGRLRLSVYKNATAINRDVEEEDREEEEAVENDDEDGENGEVKEGESVMRFVRIWKEIVGMLGVKLGQRIWAGQADAKKVGILCTKGFLIGSHCWWIDYLKPKTWKISFNPREKYYYWMP